MPYSVPKLLTQTWVGGVKEFFPPRIAPQVKKLYLATAILNFAVASVVLFEPIYLYTLGFSLSHIMWFYGGVYGLYFCIIPLGGKLVKQKGFEHGILYGSFFLVMYYSFLFLCAFNPLYLIGAAVALACQKACYWPGYHSEFAYFGERGERGREISGIVIVDSLAMIGGPLVGGLITGLFGFPVLFVAASCLILISNLPLVLSRDSFIPSSFSYRQAYADLIKPEHRRYLFAFMGFAEELIVLTIWPVFIFLTLGSTVQVGWLVAISATVSVVLVAVLGRLADNKVGKEMMSVGALLTALVWLLRMTVRGGGGIFALDFFSRVSKYMLALPLISRMYEHGVKRAHIVSTVVFFEMSLSLGKLITAMTLGVVFYFFERAWSVAFLWAACASLLYLLLGKTLSKERVRKGNE